MACVLTSDSIGVEHLTAHADPLRSVGEGDEVIEIAMLGDVSDRGKVWILLV
jgi:hypothetical protein